MGDTMLNPLVDPRFGNMFKDKDYKIDFVDDPYLHLHPEIKYAMDKIEYQQLVAQKTRMGDDSDDSDDDDNKDVDDDDILVDGQGENYDDKLMGTKEYTNTMNVDYKGLFFNDVINFDTYLGR